MIDEVLGVICLVFAIVGVCAVLSFIFSCWGHDNDASDIDWQFSYESVSMYYWLYCGYLYDSVCGQGDCASCALGNPREEEIMPLAA